MEIQRHTFPNGIRLVHKPSGSPAGHFGFMVHTGSRDERLEEHGMAHFIEHVIFKGTRKRKAFHILSRMEDVGGEINAFTSKEETCIYSTFLKKEYERAIELIHDICFNSVFPQKELNKEKNVIVDEILSYQDNPSELIFDEFEEQLFNNHAIGRNILGTEKNLLSFDRKDVLRFIENNYSTGEMVLCSVGNISFKKLIKLAEKYFGHINPKKRSRKRSKPLAHEPEYHSVWKNTHQAHCIAGNIAYGARSEKRIPLALLNNILGGPGMNSRLNLSLREKSGYTYHVESNYTTYSDIGLLSIYFGSDKEKFKKSLNLVYKEFEKIRNRKLGILQLSKAKKQLIGQLVIGSDNNEHFMLSMGRSMLIYDRVDSLEEINRKIERITAIDLLEVANEILFKDNISVLHYH